MFPSILNTFNRPTATDRLNSPSHSALHNTVSSALGQVEAVIGVDGANSVVGTMMYNLRSPASDGGGHVQTANKGGTGQTSYTKGDILVAQSSSVLTKVAVGGAGQTLVINSDTATGVQWGSIAGVPSSVVTAVPRSPLGTGFIRCAYDTTSVASLSFVNLPNPVRASVITIMTDDAVDSSGTMDLTLYRESGVSSVFTVTTPTISTTHTVYRSYLSSTVAVPAGNYYMMANTNSGVMDISHWSVSASVFSQLGNVTGSPPMIGKYAISGGSPPTSIVTTAISPIGGGVGSGSNSSLLQGLFFRIDG